MEFDKTLRFWYPRVARVTWIDFSSRTVELQPSECLENLHFSFLYSLSLSLFASLMFDFFFLSFSFLAFLLFPFLFLFSYGLILSHGNCLFCFVPIHFFSIFLFLFFFSIFFSFLLSFYLILIHPLNLSKSGGNFPPLSSMPLVILILFLIS